VIASPSLRDDFSATSELYYTFVKQMKAENPQLNVSEVSFACGKACKNSLGKRNSSGISNISNAVVDERFFEKHEYHALKPDQKNMLKLNRLTRGHVEKFHTGNGNGNGKSSGKGATLKSLTRSITAKSISSVCLMIMTMMMTMMMMMMNLQRRKKGPPTALMRI
jgi:hypothetical protein